MEFSHTNIPTAVSVCKNVCATPCICGRSFGPGGRWGPFGPWGRWRLVGHGADGPWGRRAMGGSGLAARARCHQETHVSARDALCICVCVILCESPFVCVGAVCARVIPCVSLRASPCVCRGLRPGGGCVSRCLCLCFSVSVEGSGLAAAARMYMYVYVHIYTH